ncbi:hypothetical protein AO263_35410 [Pseudomonas sp. NZIPFR-PS5]|nr:hypothetical protein AO263_35410 [Pseudomonas sp. NZIPFR-PS5]
MFGSNDDKKTPAPAGEKKGLFGWLRKKPQEATPEPPQNAPAPAPESVPDQAPAVAEQPNAPVIPAERAPQTAPQPLPQTATTEALSAPVEDPWLHLPVAEEPVAFTDEREPHVTPSIPVHTESNVESAATPRKPPLSRRLSTPARLKWLRPSSRPPSRCLIRFPAMIFLR